MLDSLEIKNFRNLKHLQIESFGAVNLIIGKNNTGKSSILEAIMIYVNKGDTDTIYQLLDDRGENYLLNQTKANADLTTLNIKSFASLFTDRQIKYNSDGAFSIGPIRTAFFGNTNLDAYTVSISFVKYRDEEWPKGNIMHSRIYNDIDESDGTRIDYKIGLDIQVGSPGPIYLIELKERLSFQLLQKPALQYVKTFNIDREANGRLWDTIALTDKEQYVIDALKIIEKNIQRIAFIEDGIGERVAKIKLQNSQDVVPLQSMGDGINRILTIILALVNADNGYLLIDEFENGLHHSVQKQLWEIVFFLSKKLNVQVFATTHSDDCIKGFESVLNSNDNQQSGKLIRLALKDGVVNQVAFNADELEMATENEIEIR